MNHFITNEERVLITSKLKSHGIRQYAIAQRIGVSPITFSRWMTGATTTIRGEHWEQLMQEIEVLKPAENIPVPADDGLSSGEHTVMTHLVDAWDSYVHLPVQHPDDLEEFRHALHRLQHLVMIREVRSRHSDYTNEEKRRES